MSTTEQSFNAKGSTQSPNLSHAERNTLLGALDNIKNKIEQRGDLPYATVSYQLELLNALSQFELGKFLLQRGGLNGYWTHYIITHPQRSSDNQHLTRLESFILDKAPSALATQQRFEIFKREIQKRLYNKISLASIPCGLTADLLDLDFSQIPDFSITGIDLDPESLLESQKIAKERGIEHLCQFIQKDAWSLNDHQEFDIIASNGLSIYEPNDEKIVDLYRQFFTALKSDGWLITSFLTPPPIPGTKTEWNLEAVNSEHALLQKILFSDILEGKWQIFRSEESVKSQLLQAGFSKVEIIYDRAHIFPTAVAQK